MSAMMHCVCYHYSKVGMNKKVSAMRQKTDGLSSIDYKIVSTEETPLFTHIKAIPGTAK